MKIGRLLVSTLILVLSLHAEVLSQRSSSIISGPMLGQVELRTASIWAEVKPGTKITLWYWKKGNASTAKKLEQSTNMHDWYSPVLFELTALDMNTTYEYELVTGAAATKPAKANYEFTTKKLWQYREPAPDFQFLAGSCTYINEPIYDRPGIPYGNDSSIFETMAKEKAAFMIWLGDNWYYREPDYHSKWGLWYRTSRDRSQPVMQKFLNVMAHYAIWDDHDYGPNDADKSYALKDESRKVFTSYWANPSYGENGQGIYTKMSYGDVDFFFMDDRTFRSADRMEPMIDGKPNPSKRMWGQAQMEWLKSALSASVANFKVIVTGSQTLNPVSPYDCLQDFPVEFDELMQFLDKQKVSGVLFLTGDRHHSEVIAYPRNGGYTLYDVTSSPLTSGIGKVAGKEKDNPSRMANTLVETQNYSRFSVTGPKGDRKFAVEFVDRKGQTLGNWSINEKELRIKTTQ